MEPTLRNAALNRVRRQQSEFLNLLIEMQCIDSAANAAGVSPRELHRWVQRPAFEKRLRRVIATMEKLKALKLRVASVKAMDHVSQVAQGKSEESTPARQFNAACTIIREKRHVDKEAARAKEKAPPDQRYDEDGQPECDCVNVLDMCHHSLTLEEKVRLYMQLRRHIYRGQNRDPESGPRDDEKEQAHVDAEEARLRQQLPSSIWDDPRKFTAGEPRHKVYARMFPSTNNTR